MWSRAGLEIPRAWVSVLPPLSPRGPTPESRIGHAVFPKAITSEGPWLTEVEKRVNATLLDRQCS